MKQIINTRIHGLLDYLSGFILLLPWILELGTPEGQWVLALTGTFTIVISLMTDYEFGIARIISMKLHLFLDVLTAIFLILLPFFFPQQQFLVYWPALLGLGELLIVVLSSSKAHVVTPRDLNITQP